MFLYHLIVRVCLLIMTNIFFTIMRNVAAPTLIFSIGKFMNLLEILLIGNASNPIHFSKTLLVLSSITSIFWTS